MAAITDPVKVGELLRAIDQLPGLDVVRTALLTRQLSVASCGILDLGVIEVQTNPLRVLI